MKKKLKAILFDVDGTLLDTTEFIYQAFEHAFRHHGLPLVPRGKLAPLMGTPLEKVYAQIMPSEDPIVLSTTHREFQKHNYQLIHVFSGVIESISKLHDLGIKMAAITSRKEHAVENLKESGLYDLLDVVLTARDVQYHKPHPEGLLKALESLSVSPEEAIIVGDTPSDIGAGKAAHMGTVGVTWGFFGPAIQQKHPDYVVGSIEELLAVVQGLI